MKTLFLLVLCLMTHLSQGQIAQFHPDLMGYPQLHPDSLTKYEQMEKSYEILLQKNIPYDSMTAEEKSVLEFEEELMRGPFSTGEVGCSWYCAAEVYALSSSSQLDSSASNSYTPNNVHDFDLRTAWVEGKPDHGIGEEITLELLIHELKTTHIELFNGYCKNQTTWKENSRVKLFSLKANDVFLGHFHLKDTYEGQRFKLGNLTANAHGKLVITLRILEIYPGDKYMDTAISEINFDGTGDH